MTDVLDSGALGIEILISGKIPSARAKSWRFYSGYLKKCGDIALGVRRAYTSAQLKTGIVGIKVSIMPSDLKLPDDVKLLKEKAEVVEELTEKEGEKVKEEIKEKVEKKEGEKEKDNQKKKEKEKKEIADKK